MFVDFKKRCISDFSTLFNFEVTTDEIMVLYLSILFRLGTYLSETLNDNIQIKVCGLYKIIIITGV